MTMLARRPWVGEASEDLIQSVAAKVAGSSSDAVDARLAELVEENRQIHDVVSTAEQKSAIRRRKTRPSCYMPGGVA